VTIAAWALTLTTAEAALLMSEGESREIAFSGLAYQYTAPPREGEHPILTCISLVTLRFGSDYTSPMEDGLPTPESDMFGIALYPDESRGVPILGLSIAYGTDYIGINALTFGWEDLAGVISLDMLAGFATLEAIDIQIGVRRPDVSVTPSTMGLREGSEMS
jgi:hypothetical protein